MQEKGYRGVAMTKGAGSENAEENATEIHLNDPDGHGDLGKAVLLGPGFHRREQDLGVLVGIECRRAVTATRPTTNQRGVPK